MCPRCKAEDTYVRELRSAEGLVLEDWHTCGWSKPRALFLVGYREPRPPATAEEWRASGIHQQAVAAGKLGGAARASHLAAKKKVKVKRKPYARQNPRKLREKMGYIHMGGLDTFRPILPFVDPTS